MYTNTKHITIITLHSVNYTLSLQAKGWNHPEYPGPSSPVPRPEIKFVLKKSFSKAK